MSRRIRTEVFQSSISGAPSDGIDGYFDRIIRYIPADVVGAWVAVSGIVSGSKSDAYGVLWLCFIFGVGFTAIWTWKQTTEPKKVAAVTQILISTVAFVVWVFALGGPFLSLIWYKPYFGSLALIGFTMLTGLVVPGRSRLRGNEDVAKVNN